MKPLKEQTEIDEANQQATCNAALSAWYERESKENKGFGGRQCAVALTGTNEYSTVTKVPETEIPHQHEKLNNKPEISIQKESVVMMEPSKTQKQVAVKQTKETQKNLPSLPPYNAQDGKIAHAAQCSKKW